MEKKELICICCPLGCMLTAELQEGKIVSVTGNTCPRGAEYAGKELTDPRRIVTSTVRIRDVQNAMVSVKTKGDIPKGKIMDCINELKLVEVVPPIRIGDVVLANIAGTGVDVIATKNYN